MKFLADMSVSPLTVLTLSQAEYDAVYLYKQGLETLPDSLILAKAKQEERIILTFDLNFGDLLAVSRENFPSVVIFRVQNARPEVVNTRLLLVLSECEADLEAGAIVIVDDTRYRLRRLPI